MSSSLKPSQSLALPQVRWMKKSRPFESKSVCSLVVGPPLPLPIACSAPASAAMLIEARCAVTVAESAVKARASAS